MFTGRIGRCGGNERDSKLIQRSSIKRIVDM